MSAEETHDLVERFIGIIGELSTIQLLQELGGIQIKLPAHAKNSVVSRIIGVENTRQLIKEFGTGKITLPCGAQRGTAGRRNRAKKLLAEGRSVTEVAKECDLHSRTVWKYRAEIRNDNQMTLPFDK